MKLTENKNLISEWDYEKNNSIGLCLEKLLSQSNKIAWWKCPEGHSWKMEIYHRSNGRKCPFCSNKRVLIGYNDLRTLYPDIANEWDNEKNVGMSIYDFVIGSVKKVWWKCSHCKHEWQTSIRSRTKHNSGCPECAKIKRGQTRHKTELADGEPLSDPLLLAEWNYERNEFGPENYLPGSNESVYWTCQTCGHVWKAKISNRTKLKRGCPSCSNNVAVAGKNDLATTHPEIAKEWHSTRNEKLTPQQVLAGSAKKIWWQCPMGHEYQASLLHRSHGTNCPICNSGRQTSFAEQAFFYYIRQLFPDARSRVQGIIGRRMELDIFIPSQNLAIEYDGVFWHKTEKAEREHYKYQKCKEKKIKLLRIKEGDLSNSRGTADECWHMDNLGDKRNLSMMIRHLLDKLDSRSNMWTRKTICLHSPIDVNVERDEFIIRSYMQNLKVESLADLYPELSAEWDYEKNSPLTPSMFKPGSTQKVWWKCPICGHEWRTDICHRAHGKTRCPVCYRRKNRGSSHTGAKRVYQYSKDWVFIRRWDCISEASRCLKINSSNITMCAKYIRPFAGGFRWEYNELEQKNYEQPNLFDE